MEATCSSETAVDLYSGELGSNLSWTQDILASGFLSLAKQMPGWVPLLHNNQFITHPTLGSEGAASSYPHRGSKIYNFVLPCSLSVSRMQGERQNILNLIVVSVPRTPKEVLMFSLFKTRTLD
jgi:hypothetical protein